MDSDETQKKWRAIQLRKENASFSVIAKLTGLSKSTAIRVWKKYQQYGTIFDRRAENGPKCKLTKVMAKKLTKLIDKHPDITSTELQTKLKDKLSIRTLRRYRRKLGFKPVKGRPISPLTKNQKRTKKE